MADNRFGDDDLDWLKMVPPGKGQKFNPHHKPPGPGGGQFTSGEEDGGGGGGGDNLDHPGEGYSAAAYEDENGVIHTDSVYDAAKALGDGRKVELSQPRTLSTLIEHLGRITKNYELLGEKAPNYNLCNVTVQGTNLFCVESKGIPRVQMPQLDEQQTRDFVAYLNEQGYHVKNGSEFASYLRATQNELNGARVARQMARIDSGKLDMTETRLIVSKDNYILDGHHRWAADIGVDARDGVLNDDKKMAITRIDISITKLLEEADKFTGGKGKKPASAKPPFTRS